MILRWVISLAGGAALAISAAAEEPSHHPSCSEPFTVVPAGSSVVDFLASTGGDQARLVHGVMDAMAVSLPSTMPAACAEFIVDCFATIDERLGAAVAQGYLTGRVALSEHDAASGIVEALEQYCLGTWTPGPP